VSVVEAFVELSLFFGCVVFGGEFAVFFFFFVVVVVVVVVVEVRKGAMGLADLVWEGESWSWRRNI
jgi:hypothetical protein